MQEKLKTLLLENGLWVQNHGDMTIEDLGDMVSDLISDLEALQKEIDAQMK